MIFWEPHTILKLFFSVETFGSRILFTPHCLLAFFPPVYSLALCFCVAILLLNFSMIIFTNGKSLSKLDETNYTPVVSILCIDIPQKFHQFCFENLCCCHNRRTLKSNAYSVCSCCGWLQNFRQLNNIFFYFIQFTLTASFTSIEPYSLEMSRIFQS